MGGILMEIYYAGSPIDVIVKNNNGILEGTLNSVRFKWDRVNYTLPLIFTKNYGEERKQICKELILIYIKIFNTQKKRLSPLVIKQSDKRKEVDIIYPSSKKYGLPKWILQYKELVWCEGKKLKYWRHTRYKTDPESLAIANKYKDYCTNCPSRESCNNPCDNPKERSCMLL